MHVCLISLQLKSINQTLHSLIRSYLVGTLNISPQSHHALPSLDVTSSTHPYSLSSAHGAAVMPLQSAKLTEHRCQVSVWNTPTLLIIMDEILAAAYSAYMAHPFFNQAQPCFIAPLLMHVLIELMYFQNWWNWLSMSFPSPINLKKLVLNYIISKH